MPLCLGTLSDTPHSAPGARGSPPVLLMGFSVFLPSCLVWFFRQVLQSCPGFSQCFGIKLSLPPPPPSSHRMHGFVCLSAPFSRWPSPQRQLQGSLPEELRENSWLEERPEAPSSKCGYKANAITKQTLSSSVNLYLHKDFGRYIGCSLILPYSFNIISKCLKSLQIQIKSVI